MTAAIFDDRPCVLGEGPLWHPGRGQLFWFDIVNKTLFSRTGNTPHAWIFPEMVSAAGWIDTDRLLVSGESALWVFDIETGGQSVLQAVDLGPDRRSNDGRADPWGGFWFSAMGKSQQERAGAIYRFFNGRVEKLFDGLTIPNAICFAPDAPLAYFADTDLGQVSRVALDPATGAPVGAPELWRDFSGEGLNPDGAVTDAAGNLWIAQWGAARVACYDPRGNFLSAVPVGAPHSSCPAFGGADFTTLFCTTAREGMDAEALAGHPHAGAVFLAEGAGPGRPEPRVAL